MNESAPICSWVAGFFNLAKTTDTEDFVPPAERIQCSFGIDLESADNLPWSGDPRSEPFYVENFTRAEIAYCTRQPAPRLSFCGLWAAKEAALKCGQEFTALRPIEIEIRHDQNGKPILQTGRTASRTAAGECAISISHSGQMAMAVCAITPRSIAALDSQRAPPLLAAIPSAAGNSAPAPSPVPRWLGRVGRVLRVAANRLWFLHRLSHR